MAVQRAHPMQRLGAAAVAVPARTSRRPQAQLSSLLAVVGAVAAPVYQQIQMAAPDTTGCRIPAVQAPAARARLARPTISFQRVQPSPTTWVGKVSLVLPITQLVQQVTHQEITPVARGTAGMLKPMAAEVVVMGIRESTQAAEGLEEVAAQAITSATLPEI